MEAVDELLPVHSMAEVVKDVSVSGDPSAEYAETGTCHKTNGIADVTTLLESADAGYTVDSVVVSEAETVQDVHPMLPHMYVASDASATVDTTAPAPFVPEAELLAAMETSAAVEHLLGVTKASEEAAPETQASTPIISEQSAQVVVEHTASALEEVSMLEIVGDQVTFTTEIVVEKDVEVNEIAVDSHDHANNILNELGQGIELSEALRSSDITDNVENNNCSRGEEVFNNEELLDILEGNDPEVGAQCALDSSDEIKSREIDKEIALNQLSRLKHTKRAKRFNIILPKKSPSTGRGRRTRALPIDNVPPEGTIQRSISETSVSTTDESNVTVETNKELKGDNDSILNDLVKDWDDDEPSEMEQSDKAIFQSNDLTKLEDLSVSQNSVVGDTPDTLKEMPHADTKAADVKESGDEAQPQKRRIKKKVPFDPDNPPTFTRKVSKRESKSKDQTPSEKEQTPTKKIKADPDQISRSKSKSPLSKMNWKKPPPKNGTNNKQIGKRLTEVDKLLMDEGAVNMIYQLTPEAPKGKKNMRTKAEFIKKVQRSEPGGKEMKFRERKKETKLEDGEPRKISGGKQRSSISSSAKSPARLEDFETHSADDSIIYRRHSSSSYSSTCMSPRRLSDVDPAAAQAAARASRQASASQNTSEVTTNQATSTDVFMGDSIKPQSTPEVVNKGSLSIKDKLSKKISQALNKRKRKSLKTEKLHEEKKILMEPEVVKVEQTDVFKYVSVTFDQRLAEICILKAGPSEGIMVFKELDQALKKVDSMKEISVTLLTSECGGLSSKIDLNPLLDTNMEKRTNYAYEVAESIRRVLSSAATHSKLLVCGAWGACGGVALALMVLGDTALATDTARFCAASLPPAPGLAALTAGPRTLPTALVNELVVFGRWLSTTEAAAVGLVTRVWPGDADSVRRAAANIAQQPPQNIHLKKQLLNLSKTSEAMARFHTSLEKERDMLVEYWTSIEGQDVIRTSIGSE